MANKAKTDTEVNMLAVHLFGGLRECGLETAKQQAHRGCQIMVATL